MLFKLINNVSSNQVYQYFSFKGGILIQTINKSNVLLQDYLVSSVLIRTIQ